VISVTVREEFALKPPRLIPFLPRDGRKGVISKGALAKISAKYPAKVAEKDKLVSVPTTIEQHSGLRHCY
jgi:hypothetical protein